MCHDVNDYNEFPPQTIGGPTGNYTYYCPVDSNKEAEYCVVLVSNGDAGPGSAYISGESEKTSGLKYDGTQTVGGITTNQNSAYPGIAIRLGQYTTLPLPEIWHRIVDTDQRIHVRIDAQANTSIFVTLKYRVKLLTMIPAPFTTVPHTHEELAHIQREQKIQQAVYGKVGEKIISERTLVGMQKKASIKEPLTAGHVPVEVNQ